MAPVFCACEGSMLTLSHAGISSLTISTQGTLRAVLCHAPCPWVSPRNNSTAGLGSLGCSYLAPTQQMPQNGFPNTLVHPYPPRPSVLSVLQRLDSWKHHTDSLVAQVLLSKHTHMITEGRCWLGTWWLGSGESGLPVSTVAKVIIYLDGCTELLLFSS